MDTVSWRIQNNEIRLFFNGINDLQDISRDKFAVGSLIADGVFLCGFYGFFHNFNTDHLGSYRCNQLRDRSRSAVEIEHHRLFGRGRRSITGSFRGLLRVLHCPGDHFPCRFIQKLCSEAVCLEEGERRDRKLQPKQLLLEAVLSIQNIGSLILHNIRHGIIVRMQDPGNSALIFTLQKSLPKSIQKNYFRPLLLWFQFPPGFPAFGQAVRLRRCDKIHQDFPCLHALPDQQMPEVSLPAHSMIERYPGCGEVHLCSVNDFTEIRIHYAAFVGIRDIIK
ncbi:unknown [Firmicutes bacterium CAG:791]|nr:unknown [Firmicutes bacterium CAG:791]